MRQAFPEMQGFSKRNLEYIRRFAQLYPQIEFAKQPVSQLLWGHIVRLMQMVKDEAKREWYAELNLKGSLPTIEEIEAELNESVNED